MGNLDGPGIAQSNGNFVVPVKVLRTGAIKSRLCEISGGNCGSGSMNVRRIRGEAGFEALHATREGLLPSLCGSIRP